MMESIRAKNTKVAGSTICGEINMAVGCGMQKIHKLTHACTHTCSFFSMFNLQPYNWPWWQVRLLGNIMGSTCKGRASSDNH